MSALIKLFLELCVKLIEDALVEVGQEILERVSLLMSKFVYLLFALFVLGLALIFFLVSGALFLGQYLESNALGFLCIALFSSFCLLVMLWKSQKGHGAYHFFLWFFSKVFSK